MYCCTCVSKEAVSVTLVRKGLLTVLSVRVDVCSWDTLQDTYKRPVRVLSVEIEDALKAGHCVELANEMQFWAITPGRITAARA